MNTQLKNQWIALEEKYHKLLKEKVNQYNSSSNSPIPQPLITSQLTFCKDGVIIKKHNHPDFKNGISVKVYDKTMAEMKLLKDYNAPGDKTLLPISEYNNKEIANYDPYKMVEHDFIHISSK